MSNNSSDPGSKPGNAPQTVHGGRSAAWNYDGEDYDPAYPDNHRPRQIERTYLSNEALEANHDLGWGGSR